MSNYALTRENMERALALALRANASYCKAIGDPEPKQFDELDETMKQSYMDGLVHRLNHPAAPLSEAHSNWMVARLEQGWKLGETKDEAAKTHPNLVPYAELPKEQKFKDRLFATIVLEYFGLGARIKDLVELRV